MTDNVTKVRPFKLDAVSIQSAEEPDVAIDVAVTIRNVTPYKLPSPAVLLLVGHPTHSNTRLRNQHFQHVVVINSRVLIRRIFIQRCDTPLLTATGISGRIWVAPRIDGACRYVPVRRELNRLEPVALIDLHSKTNSLGQHPISCRVRRRTSQLEIISAVTGFLQIIEGVI